MNKHDKTDKSPTTNTAPPRPRLSRLLELYEGGHLAHAEEQAILLTKEFPLHQFGWKILAMVLHRTGRISNALSMMQRSIQLSPFDAEAHCNLGSTLQIIGAFSEAESSLRKAIALNPTLAEAHINLGKTLRELGRPKEAEASFRRAIVLKPEHSRAYYNLGVALEDLGRFGEAEASYSQAIVLEPNFVNAHINLAGIRKFPEKQEQLEKLQDLYFDLATSPEQKSNICFVLAKAFEELKEFPAAFEYYQEGNALRRKKVEYNFEQDERLFSEIKNNWEEIASHSLKPQDVDGDLCPIFIVGMPRSGTTLIEQIVSAHSQVTGAGELPYVSKFGGQIATGVTPPSRDALKNFRQEYLTALSTRSQGNVYVTDKMPLNFRFLGLIVAAFPEAKIIHVKRDPAAVCWANFTQNFSSRSLRYCNDLGDIIRYYGLYKNLMGYWDKFFQEVVHKVHYELITTNQEFEVRRLLSRLQLEWEDACLAPEDNDRSVGTASREQVRRKIYQGSSDLWKRYIPYLGGELDKLHALT